MTLHTLTIDTLATNSQVASRLALTKDGQKNLINFKQLIDDMLIGMKQSGTNNRIQSGLVAATATLTSTAAAVAAETFTLNGVVFTARASAPAANEFILSATPATQAANIAAAINASVTVGVVGLVLATNVAGVTTLTATTSGPSGDGFTLTESLTGVTAVDWAGGLAASTSVAFKV